MPATTVPAGWRARLARARWYLDRARAMPPAEIVHRLREARVKARWRRRPPGWDAGVGDGPLRASALLRARLAAGADIPGVREGARATLAGRMTFLGRDWPAVDWTAGAGAAFWLHDPVTGRRWPGAEASFLAIDVRGTGTDPDGPRRGDAKYVWEPGRLQMLHPLAAAAAAGDTGAAAATLAVLRDFARANPPYGGVHWVSGIEVALRLVAASLVLAALRPDDLGAEDRALIRRFVAAHGRHLAAFPSLHSSANNHRVAEGLGLFLAGLLLPDLGAAWEAEGRAILETEALRQIRPDGGGAERSLVYQAFTTEMTALAALLAAEDGRPFAAPVLDRLGSSAAFLRAMLDEGGRAPAIGDDDETRVIGQPPDREPRYVASVVAAVAGLLRRPDLLPPARDAALRDAVFAVPAGAGRTEAVVSTFAETGCSAVRDTLAGARIHLVLDHGPLGYLGLAAHGHADALAVWLSVDGEPVLIDPGTYLYHSGGALRRTLRESPAHNTLSVEGRSYARATSAFSWSERADARLVASAPAPGWTVAGAHDGYRRRFGVTHRRAVARDGEGIAIRDSLTGRGPCAVELRFLLPRGLDLAVSGATVAVARSGRVLCRLTAPAGFAVSVQRGGEAVRSPRFGEVEDAQRIVLAGRLGAQEAVTRLAFG